MANENHTLKQTAPERAGFRLPSILKVLLGVMIALELIAPFVAQTYGVDGPSQLNMIAQFTRLVSQGVALPSWAPDAFFGFGSATFYFYPPVAFYLASLVHFITGSLDAKFLFQMTGLVATMLSFFSARSFLRYLGASRYGRNLGALLYAFAPFRIAEIYSRSSISSHVAYVLIPLFWYGLVAISNRRPGMSRLKAVVFLGIAAALLALSSVPLILATTLCVIITAIVFRKELSFEAVWSALWAVCIAIGLSAFHFFGVVSAAPFAQLNDLTVFDPEYILTSIMHGKNLAAAYHIALLYLAYAAVIVTWWRAHRQRENIFKEERGLVMTGIALCSFLVLLEIPVLSHPLWGWVQPFILIQGVWRFYINTLLLGVVIVAKAERDAMCRAASIISWLWIAGAILPAMLVVFNLHVFSHTEGPGGDPTEYLPIYTLPVQKQGIAELERHADEPRFIATLQGNEHLDLVRAEPTSSEIDAQLTQARCIVFHRFFWPAWHLYSDGIELPSKPDSMGRATAWIPAGHHTLRWKLEMFPMERAGRWVTGATIFLLVSILGINFFRHRYSTLTTRRKEFFHA
jgi:hypothetical protein